MVWWDDPRRGVWLGPMRGLLGLSVTCTACGRIARIRREVALRLWGERTFARDVARDLRCSRCGAAKAAIQVVVDVRPPEAKARDPDGGWRVGPAWPEVDPPSQA